MQRPIFSTFNKRICLAALAWFLAGAPQGFFIWIHLCAKRLASKNS